MAVVPNGNRVEDQDVWARTSLFLARYRIIFWPIIVAAGYAWIRLQDTARILPEVQARVIAVEHRVTAVEQANQQTDDKIVILLRLRCIDGSLTDRERELAGLDCRQLVPNDRSNP